MPIAHVRGVNLNYEIIGRTGPWIAMSPGGRRAIEDVRGLADHMAGHGYRVLVVDRRNCGLSDVSIDASQPEYEVWADDLHALLGQLNALPAIVGGGSSGCRLSVLFALKYPSAVRALLLMRVTGGQFAVNRLTRKYYFQYIEAARRGGMAAVCETDHFSELIALRPDQRATLMAMDVDGFVAAMETWRVQFEAGATMPMIGATEADLQAIRAPTCIVPGNDRTHNHAVGDNAHRLIAGSELHDLFPGDLDVDIVQMHEWAPKEKQVADVFADFLVRNRLNVDAPPGQIRRVVTGHDANGKAVVVSDGFAPVVHTSPMRPGYASTELWRTSASPAPIVAHPAEPTLPPRRQLPDARGTVLRINTLAPESEAIRLIDPAQAQELFTSLGNATASTYAANGRHPLMHRTPTIDYVIVLSGEVTMLLDDSEVLLKAGDVMVQCGTNHAWSNRGSVPCQIAFVLVDGEFDPQLAERLP